MTYAQALRRARAAATRDQESQVLCRPPLGGPNDWSFCSVSWYAASTEHGVAVVNIDGTLEREDA